MNFVGKSMKMKFLYTALGVFDKACEGEKWPDFVIDPPGERSWERFIEWSKLYHLTELVSLDRMHNEDLVDPDYKNAEDWNYIHITTDEAGQSYQSGLYTSPDYVAKRPKVLARDRYNLLAVVVEPDQECRDIVLEGFEFVGYELLDQAFSISVLTNCGGLDGAHFPTDLNDKGLVDDFSKVRDIQKRCLEMRSVLAFHADTTVIAVWRHKTIGRLCGNVSPKK